MDLLREIKRLQQTILKLQALILRMGQTVGSEQIELLEMADELIQLEPCAAERDFDEQVRNAGDIAYKRNTMPREPKYNSRLR